MPRFPVRARVSHGGWVCRGEVLSHLFERHAFSSAAVAEAGKARQCCGPWKKQIARLLLVSGRQLQDPDLEGDCLGGRQVAGRASRG